MSAFAYFFLWTLAPLLFVVAVLITCLLQHASPPAPQGRESGESRGDARAGQRPIAP